VRDSVVINVSYFFGFASDGTLPSRSTIPGIARGAAMLYAAAEYRQEVCSGNMPPETIGKKATLLDSTAFKYMFHACRLPQLQEDVYRLYDPSRHTHVTVACNGHFFAMDIVDPDTGAPLSMPSLEAGLEAIVEKSGSMPSAESSLSWLTSQDRDAWATARTDLLQLEGMSEALEKLESGAFLLCLDDESALSKRELSTLYLHGSNVNFDKSYLNRWFDKSIQLICTLQHGKTGYLGEHSLMDGMPIVRFADHITKTTYSSAVRRSKELHGDKGGVPKVEIIFDEGLLEKISNSQTAMEHIEQAKSYYKKLVSSHDLQVQSFHGFGSSFIKKSGFSPDAFVQMAMQLATYRLFGEQVGTYEATQMRPYLHGRTETTRSVSPQSSAFLKGMGLRRGAHEQTPQEMLELLRDATTAHSNYIRSASQGYGVDRHLFGLSMLVTEGDATPTLFTDPLYTRAKRWRVSTSNLTHPNFDNWGYGEVVPDGVGLAYAVHSNRCIFNVTALREHDWTERLSYLLEEALLEMRDLVNEASVQNPQSKL